MQGPDLLGPELPDPHPHGGQPGLEPVPEGGERPEATGVLHAGEAIDILEQQGLAEDTPVQWTVAVPAGEEEEQLAPPEGLLPEPLHLGLDVGPHHPSTPRCHGGLVAADVRLYVAVHPVEEMERHRLLEASNELPERFPELLVALVLQKPSVHPGHSNASDVVAPRRLDEHAGVKETHGGDRVPLLRGSL